MLGLPAKISTISKSTPTNENYIAVTVCYVLIIFKNRLIRYGVMAFYLNCLTTKQLASFIVSSLTCIQDKKYAIKLEIGGASNYNNYRSTTRIYPLSIDILFLIYINDWPNCLSFWQPRMYVDNTHITYASTDAHSLQSSNILNIHKWLLCNKLTLIYSEYPAQLIERNRTKNQSNPIVRLEFDWFGNRT